MLPAHLGSTGEASGPWSFAEVIPRFEKSLAKLLAREGLDYYLPLTIVRRQWWSHGKKDSLSPLFPGYIFVAGPEAEAFIRDTPARITHIFECGIHAIGNQPRFRRELSNLEMALSINPCLRVAEISKPGQKVRVTRGPFQNYQGDVEAIKEGHHGMVPVHIRIVTLGQPVVLEIDRSDLELL